MRIHAACGLDARAWPDSAAKNASAERIQLRIGVTRYAATVAEARLLAAELSAAAAAVESSDEGVGND